MFPSGMIPYRTDLNELIRNNLSLVIEYLAFNYSDDGISMKTRRAGRTVVIIEGNDELVAPYLEAVREVQSLIQEGGE